ncbi:glycosyltransferase [Bordetella genomosp. 10]|nr:glycosyltransferase [Bordetella genomosp. 10]
MPPDDEKTQLAILQDQLEAAEARYERAMRDLERMRRAFARTGGSASSRELQRLRHEITVMRNSNIWRATAPVRFVLDTVKRPKAAVARLRNLLMLVRHSAATDGWPATLKKIEMKLGRHFGGVGRAKGAAMKPLQRLGAPAPARLVFRVLLIAETTLPQCFKYRVLQKQKMIEQLGYECTIVSWRNPDECMHELQTHALAILYRTPSFPEVMKMIAEARQLGVPTLWEVDDLIFDADKYSTNANLKDLHTAEMEHLLRDANLYRQAMVACDGCIASTPALATAMLESGSKQAYVIENALDVDTLRIAEAIGRNGAKPVDGFVRIVYGSGTRTHDTDFRQIAPAILQVMRNHENVRLRIIGHLRLSVDFEAYEGRIERYPLSDYATYLNLLSECDINIAPLEDSVFSDAKSNIKFLEGAIVGLPTVCSPRSAFKAAITDGLDSYLADGVAEWREALEKLVTDPQLRKDMGVRARERALDGYGHLGIGTRQVLPVLKQFERPDTRPKLRVLAVNIFFEPRSFGGATVVAEEMAKSLGQREDIEYSVFTTLPTERADAYQIVRYDAKGSVVFGMGLPPEGDRTFDYDNPQVYGAFMQAIRALQPNVVHLHCIQGMGAGLVDICQAEGIPYAVTLHDAWWICARQFMITPANRYCYQTTINLDVCSAHCISRLENEPRQDRLREALMGADLLLSPSVFFRELYIQNGFDPDRVVVNKNGVKPRAHPRLAPKGENRKLRFGYVGGDSYIKGAPLIKKFFSSTPHTNYELVVVDNALNLGMHSISAKLWACTGTLKVVPAFTQETIDDFFDSIDVLLFPTQWKESFGLAVREALLRDVWVVATDAGGVAEDIVDGENGSIIPFDDKGEQLAVVLSALLEHPERLFDFKNPYADKIRLFDEQANELYGLLADIVR